jgi:hypothetical protein
LWIVLIKWFKVEFSVSVKFIGMRNTTRLSASAGTERDELAWSQKYLDIFLGYYMFILVSVKGGWLGLNHSKLALFDPMTII